MRRNVFDATQELYYLNDFLLYVHRTKSPIINFKNMTFHQANISVGTSEQSNVGLGVLELKIVSKLPLDISCTGYSLKKSSYLLWTLNQVFNLLPSGNKNLNEIKHFHMSGNKSKDFATKNCQFSKLKTILNA